MHTVTVNLSDAIAEAEERIEQAREAYEDLEQFAEDEYDSVEAAPDVVYQRLQAYEQAASNFRGRSNVIEQTLKRWGGPTQGEHGEWTGDGFELKMMSGPEAAMIEDKVGAAGVALQQDVGAAPRDMPGERVIEVLDVCVVDEPEGIPGDGDPPHLEAYPSPVTLWLYEKVNNLNTAGDPNFEPVAFGDETASDSSSSAISPGDGSTTPPSPTTSAER